MTDDLEHLRRARAASVTPEREARALKKAKQRARMWGITPPAWVPAHMERRYLETALAHGEYVAARCIRRDLRALAVAAE